MGRRYISESNQIIETKNAPIVTPSPLFIPPPSFVNFPQNKSSNETTFNNQNSKNSKENSKEELSLLPNFQRMFAFQD
jgi:hypothetical protein